VNCSLVSIKSQSFKGGICGFDYNKPCIARYRRLKHCRFGEPRPEEKNN